MRHVFSVVIPAYNRASVILETLESVYAQGHRPIELIVVDDGSSDETCQVIKSWITNLQEKEQEPKDLFDVRLIEQENGGVSKARNAGLSHANGEYVYFLDSDDLLENGALSALKSAFESDKRDMVFAGFRRFDEDAGDIVMHQLPKAGDDLVAKALEGRLWGNAGRISLRRSFADRIGPWNEAYRVFEDREYSERAVMLAKEIAVLEVSLVRVRVGSGPRQNDLLRTRMGRGFRIACEEELAGHARRRNDVSETSWRLFRERIYGLSMRSYAEGWREHGRSSKKLADGIPVSMTSRGKLRRKAAQFGVIGSRLYLLLGAIKNFALHR